MNKLITLLIIILTYLNTQAQNFTITATPWQSVIPCESDLGIITTSVSGGTPPYAYQWSDGSTTADLGYIFAGTYSVTVSDANLNTANASATITEYPYFWGHISYYAPTPGNCNGGIIWSPWQPREGLLYLDSPGPFTPIWGSSGLGLHQCASSSPVTINLFTWLGCPWLYNGFTIDPSQYTSGPYTINKQILPQNACISNVEFKIYNQNKLNSQTMPAPLPGGGANVYTHIEIRDLQNNLIKDIFLPPGIQLIQYQDSVTYNFTSLTPGTYVFHYVEGLYKYDMFTSPLDTFGIHLTDTFTVTGTGTLPLATISTTGSTSLCSGDSLLLTATFDPDYTYQWKRNNNNISGATSSTFYAKLAGNYTVVITNICGSATSNIISVSVTNLPTVSISASGAPIACNGNYVLINSSTSGGQSYQWQLDDNNISGFTISYFMAYDPGNYSLIVTNSCGSTTSNSVAISTYDTPVASITSSGSTSLCGDSVILNANTGAGFTYQWKLNGNNITGATSSSFIAANPGNYSVLIFNPCGSSTSNVISITTGAAPSAAITASGSTSICAGGSVTLNANTGTGLSYQWQLNGNNISGATASSYSATTAGNYTAIVSNACGSSTSNVVSVNVSSISSGFITTLGYFPCPNQCNGSLFVLDSLITGTPPYSYSHTGAGNFNVISGGISITNLCDLDYVEIIVTDANGCTGSDFYIVYSVPIQNPSFTITPACNLNNGSVTVTNLIGAGWNCGAIRIRDDNYNFITNGTTGMPTSLPGGNYILETYCSAVWLETGPCPQYFPFTIPSGTTIATISASGSTSICSGTSVALNANTGTGLSYQWQLNNNSINGATLSSYSATLAGDYSVVVTDSCGSNTSNIVTVTINSTPSAAISVSGSTSICIGSSVILNANTGTGLSYQWQLNGNNISGATTSTYSASTAGNYTAVVSNACGSSTSNVISVTTGSAPSAAITASGSTSICAGGSVTLNANTGIALTYQWQLNGNNISGATASSYSASTAGNYIAVVSNACGSSTSNVISVTTGAAPSAAITASGSTSICAGGSVTLNANTGTGLSYQWQLNGNNISGETASSYSVTTSGNYSVVVTNSCGNSISNIIAVSVISAPGSAGSISGPTSFCRHSTQSFSVAPVTGATNYVWAVPHQAQIIAGQGTNSVVVSFKVKQGDVTVKATNQCGAGPLSVLPVQVVKCFHSNNAVMRTNSSKEVLFYPNPSKDEFNCIINSDSELLFLLLVYDYAGRIVELKENIIPNENFTFGYNLAPGFYFVEISSGEEKDIFKIIKTE